MLGGASDSQCGTTAPLDGALPPPAGRRLRSQDEKFSRNSGVFVCCYCSALGLMGAGGWLRWGHLSKAADSLPFGKTLLNELSSVAEILATSVH